MGRRATQSSSKNEPGKSNNCVPLAKCSECSLREKQGGSERRGSKVNAFKRAKGSSRYTRPEVLSMHTGGNKLTGQKDPGKEGIEKGPDRSFHFYFA